MKFFIKKIIMLLIMISIVPIPLSYAQDTFKYNGVVGAYDVDKGELSVSGKVYLFDRESVIHSAISDNKLNRSPRRLSRGQKVEFNVERNRDARFRISELRLLSE